jgi:hypothetical protein
MFNTPLDMFRELQKDREEYLRQTAKKRKEAKLLYVNQQLGLVHREMYRLMDKRYEEPRA